MKLNLTRHVLTLACLGMFYSGAAQAEFGNFPGISPDGPADLFPEYPEFPELPTGPDFPEGPDLGDFPGIPGGPGGVVCFSIHEPTGQTFSGTGSKSGAASRALAECQQWQAQNDRDGLGRCQILSCDTLIDFYR